MGPMPGTGTLLGGDGYMFNKKDTPDQINYDRMARVVVGLARVVTTLAGAAVP